MKYINVRLPLIFSFLTVLFLFQVTSAQGTAPQNKAPFPVKYTSLVDQKIILKTITLAPVYDNVDGIYANPIQRLLVDLLQTDKVWGYAEFPDMDKKIFIEKFDSEPNDVIEALTKTGSQGLLTAFITKGPRGLNAKLKLFTQDQGLVLLEESFQDINTFAIAQLRESFVNMYVNLKNRLPYRGYVLSRRGLDVTLNLGAMNGVKIGQQLTLAQIIKINRHPKLKTMVGTEKEIIARVTVTKVEPYLSFAQITFEKETGVVDVGAKILPSEYVAYPQPVLNKDGAVIGDQVGENSTAPMDSTESINITPAETTDFEVSSGNEPLAPELVQKKQSLLDRENSSGVLTAQGVITQYSESSELSNGTTVSAKQSFAPGAHLGVKYFIGDGFYGQVGVQMNQFNANNSLAGSTPFTLSYNYFQYAGLLGYDYRFSEEGDDPIILGAALGISSYKTTVSASTPTALTSTQTDTILLQFKGEMLILPEHEITAGARFDLALNPKLKESPVSSGDSKPSITAFSFYGIYPLSYKLRTRFDLGIAQLQTSFSGATTRTPPARSTSINLLNLQMGVEYLF